MTRSAHMESGWPSRGTGLEPLKSLASALTTAHSWRLETVHSRTVHGDL